MIVSLQMYTQHSIQWRYFSFLELFPVMIDTEADKRGLCKNCDWAYHCHPILMPSGTKLCTRLFRKWYMPKLRIQQLV